MIVSCFYLTFDFHMCCYCYLARFGFVGCNQQNEKRLCCGQTDTCVIYTELTRTYFMLNSHFKTCICFFFLNARPLFTLCDLVEDVIRERTGFYPLLSCAPKAGRHSSAMSYKLQNHKVMYSAKMQTS